MLVAIHTLRSEYIEDLSSRRKTMHTSTYAMDSTIHFALNELNSLPKDEIVEISSG